MSESFAWGFLVGAIVAWVAFALMLALMRADDAAERQDGRNRHADRW